MTIGPAVGAGRVSVRQTSWSSQIRFTRPPATGSRCINPRCGCPQSELPGFLAFRCRSPGPAPGT